MKTILYLASTGYSGTTLLDMLLNQDKQITALGEVYLLSEYAKKNFKCTCGEFVNECSFWSSIESSLKESLNDPTLSFGSFPLTMVDKIQSQDRKIPTFNDLLLVLGIRFLWKALSGLTQTSKQYYQSANNAITLFSIISEKESTPVIVDSSKYALPLKALYLNSPVPVRVIYMVRDGRAVCRSLGRRHKMTYAQAAHYWVRYNRNLKLIMATIPKADIKLVRYEDLCTHTNTTLESIYDFIGIDAYTSNTLDKSICHNIGGNPMRLRKQERDIKLDEKWKEEITQKEAAIFETIAGKMNRSFGYN